jgi:hypothetical protein
MNPTARRIDQILTDAPIAATLLARLAAGRRAARAIAPVCAEVTPEFDPLRPGTCDLRGGVLRIWLPTNAQATRLRQALPRLAAALQGHGVEVSEIKVALQLGRVRERAPSNPRNNAADASVRSAEQTGDRQKVLEIIDFSRKLALTLPDSELRRAIVRFGRSADARLARMRDSDPSFDKQKREKSDTGGESGEQ